MSPTRQWWAKAMLLATGLTGLFLLLAFLIGTLSTPWAAWLLILFCWGSILSLGAVLLVSIGFITRSPMPNFDHFWNDTHWALVGGIAGFSLPLSEWLWSCCHQGDMYLIVCFGPLLFLMGFAIGGWAGRSILTLIAIFLAPIIGSYLEPSWGETAALLVTILIVIGALGVTLHWRFGRPKN